MASLRRAPRRLARRLKHLGSSGIRLLLTAPRRPLRWPAAGRRSSDRSAIFVVGYRGSESRCVGALLNRHPRLACVEDTQYLAGLLEQLRNPFFVGGLKAIGISRQEAAANIREYACLHYERFLYREEKARWVDATAAYIDYCRELDAVFGRRLRIVHVVRHGARVVEAMQLHGAADSSEEQAMPGAHETIEDAARRWARAVEAVRQFEAIRPSRCCTVRFEDLVANPEQEMRRVLAFIGEPWHPVILQGALATGDDDGRPLQQEQLAGVEQILSAGLRSYGYSGGMMGLAR